MGSWAKFSDDEQYRYALGRGGNPDLFESHDAPLVALALNPSTAGAAEDDPSSRRIQGFGKRWGYSGIVIVNLYGYQATNPEDLLKAKDPIGPDNDRHILEQIQHRDVLCCWGGSLVIERMANEIGGIERCAQVLDLIRREGNPRQLYMLGLTNHGEPRHPLYVLGRTERQSFKGCAHVRESDYQPEG